MRFSTRPGGNWHSSQPHRSPKQGYLYSFSTVLSLALWSSFIHWCWSVLSGILVRGLLKISGIFCAAFSSLVFCPATLASPDYLLHLLKRSLPGFAWDLQLENSLKVYAGVIRRLILFVACFSRIIVLYWNRVCVCACVCVYTYIHIYIYQLDFFISFVISGGSVNPVLVTPSWSKADVFSHLNTWWVRVYN